MKKKVYTFTIILLIAITFANCNRKQPGLITIEDGKLTVGVEIGYPPMEYYDTDGITLLGFDIELVRALAERLGLEAVFVDTAWEGIFAGLETDKYDIAVNITILPERQERFNFTNPYIDSSMTIVALKNSPIRIEQPQDIAGFRVAYQGYTTAQYFTERLRNNETAFPSFSYEKIINCFDDLLLGRVHLVVVDNIVANYYTEREGSPFHIIWQGPTDEYIGICLKKGNDALTQALNDVLDELFADGTLREISMRIFNRDLVSSLRDF